MIVYRITNLVTNKSYVGVTTTSLEQRFKEHCWQAVRGDSQYLLYRSMRKHGIENFMIEEFATVLGAKDDLFELEKSIIAQEQTEQPSGYNMTSGGENPPNRSGAEPWNKGKKLSEQEKQKLNMSGLSVGHGFNKGKKLGPMNEKTKSAISKTLKGQQKPEGFSEKIKASWEKRRAAKAAATQILETIQNKEALWSPVSKNL